MNPDVKEQWIAALLGGEYKQATRRMVQKDLNSGELSYCCMGVLADLAVKAGVEGLRWSDQRPGYPPYLVDHNELTYAGMPCESVHEWAGLDEKRGRFLATLNDKGAPFAAIAAAIRELT